MRATTAARVWMATGDGTSVDGWIWTRRNGLRVVYRGDDVSFRSDWYTLRAFVTALKAGRERAREITRHHVDDDAARFTLRRLLDCRPDPGSIRRKTA